MFFLKNQIHLTLGDYALHTHQITQEFASECPWCDMFTPKTEINAGYITLMHSLTH